MEICYQCININELIGSFQIDTVSVVTLAPFVVITHQAVSFGVPIIESVFQTKRVMSGARHLPEDHLAQCTISIHESRTM